MSRSYTSFPPRAFMACGATAVPFFIIVYKRLSLDSTIKHSRAKSRVTEEQQSNFSEAFSASIIGILYVVLELLYSVHDINYSAVCSFY
jgi:hypothetical protein